MTVKQLIKYLKKFDQNAIVVCESEPGVEFYTVNELEIKDLSLYGPGKYYEIYTDPNQTQCLVIK